MAKVSILMKIVIWRNGNVASQPANGVSKAAINQSTMALS
jgi:hypothetical protein